MSKQVSNIWGGRFQQSPSEVMQAINASIDVDKRLWRQDLWGSQIHCQMLYQQGLISQDDYQAIQQGLKQIGQEIEDGQFCFLPELEDIHMNVEHRLRQLIGEPAGRLHTARSRNDQVALDLRLWIRDAIDSLQKEGIIPLLLAFCEQAKQHADTLMPGFTHLQTAQPIVFGHHLLAYVEMLWRDYDRLSDCRRRLNECPLGAAALAGTSFPIDRQMTAENLGFDKPTRNSLDSVSARDYALEFSAVLSIMMTHLSRLAEEMVIWCSSPFHFVSLGDRWTTGSSIMPQKRNPDAAELIRAKTGNVNGALVALLTMMKGLPMAYAKDMQEDKQAVFSCFDNTSLALVAMQGMIQDMVPHKQAMKQAAAQGFSTATDLADWLVRVLGLPFRKAHHITGQIVKMAEQRGCDLVDLPLSDMQSECVEITQDVYSVLGIDQSVRSRISYGGTCPDNVMTQISDWQQRLADIVKE